MNKQNKIGFTLVELIVVITILSVLATIGFISFSGYTLSARDSVRLADINNIQKGLSVLKAKAIKYPIPDDKVNITSSGNILNYQGYAGGYFLGSLGISGGGLDPLTQEYYTITTNVSRTRYQLLSFFENEENVKKEISGVSNSYAVESERYIQLIGDKLGIIVNSTTKEPLQKSGMGIDISESTSTYEVHISEDEIITGTEVLLGGVLPNANCNRIKEFNNEAENGKYMIDPLADGNESEVYCDMTTDGGGWTLISSDYSTLENELRLQKYPEYNSIGSNFDSKILANEILHINETNNLLGEDVIKRHIVFDSYLVNGVDKIHDFVGLITGLKEYEEVFNSRAYTDRLFGGKILSTSQNQYFEFDQVSRMGISVTITSVDNHNLGYSSRSGRSCNYIIGKTWDCFEYGKISDNRINGKNYNSTAYRNARGVNPIIKQQVYIR